MKQDFLNIYVAKRIFVKNRIHFETKIQHLRCLQK